MDSGWADLLPPLAAMASLLRRHRQATAAYVCWACRDSGKGLAGAPRCLGWPHSGAKATHQRTWQQAIPSDELQPTSMTLERNSRFSPDNKKIHISVSFLHLAEYHMKHVCFKHISKELLDVYSLREDEKGHSVAGVVLGRCDERIWGMRGKNWGPRRGLLGTGV